MKIKHRTIDEEVKEWLSTKDEGFKITPSGLMTEFDISDRTARSTIEALEKRQMLKDNGNLGKAKVWEYTGIL